MPPVEPWPVLPRLVAVCLDIGSWLDQVRCLPKPARNGEGFDIFAPPPGTLVATPVKLAMVQPADRHGEAVADLASHGPLLRKLDVVGI